MQQFKSFATFAAWLMVLAWAPAARTQVVNGTILGTVRDSSGAVIPNVTVSAKSVETGAGRSAVTDTTGAYQILSVPASPHP